MRVQSVQRIDKPPLVYDIQVAKNCNFFVRPLGTTKACTGVLLHNSLLKPLEEPPPHTLWIIATTDPQKLPAAIQGRCMHLPLDHVSVDDIVARLTTIATAESLTLPEASMVKIAELSGGHVRNAVNLLEGAANFIKSKKGIGEEELAALLESEVLKTVDTATDNVAIKILLGMYVRKPAIVCKGIADMQEPIPLVNKLIQFNQYLIDCLCIQGRHPNVWHTASNLAFKKTVESKTKLLQSDAALVRLLQAHNTLVSLRSEMQTFAVPERNLITARLGVYSIKVTTANTD